MEQEFGRFRKGSLQESIRNDVFDFMENIIDRQVAEIIELLGKKILRYMGNQANESERQLTEGKTLCNKEMVIIIHYFVAFNNTCMVINSVNGIHFIFKIVVMLR